MSASMAICLPGQRVESEARRHLGGAHGAVRDHQKLDGDQRQKEHETHHIIPAHHELSEGLNHSSCGRCSFRSMQENAAARSDVERQTKQRQQQQEGRKDAQLDRAANLHRGQKNENRGGHRNGQQKVKRRGRKRNQHDENHADCGQGQNILP